jgi:4-hydroxy-tetrahydrodipicolinate reductase
MRVGQIGFGRAGRPVASVLLESGVTRLEWVLRRTPMPEAWSVPQFLRVESQEPGRIYSTSEVTAAELFDRSPVDAVVDFSSADGIHYYGEEAAARGITVVTAVSSYPDATHAYIRAVAERTRVLCSPNITLGINFLMIAAKVLRQIAPEADVEIVERHFKAKKEVSGTARKIATMLDLPDDSVKALRAGGIVGVHEVLFGFPHQTITLTHESLRREAFGTGIIFALQHLQHRPVGLYGMEDLLLPYFAAAIEGRDDVAAAIGGPPPHGDQAVADDVLSSTA